MGGSGISITFKNICQFFSSTYLVKIMALLHNIEIHVLTKSTTNHCNSIMCMSVKVGQIYFETFSRDTMYYIAL